MESGAVKIPLWLWPNVLSLDAPIVAVLWQALFARGFHVPLSPWPMLVLAATVWLIYSADRVLDAKRGLSDSLRHRFYQRHWRFIVALWTLVIPATAWLALEHFPRVLFERGLLLLGLVGAYLVTVHVFDKTVFQTLWFKETAVGVLFALGVSVTTWSEIRTPADAVALTLFAALCTINCVAIERAESEQRESEHAVLSGAITIALFASALLLIRRPILAEAEIVSAAALLLLNHARLGLSRNALRVLADVTLLSPLLFLLP